MKGPSLIRIPQIIILLPIILLLGACSGGEISEHTVMKGSFTASFTESGELEAKKALAVPLARMDYRYGYSFKIIDMIPNGTYVNEGDTLMKLDDSNIQKFLISTEEALEKEMAAEAKLKVEYQNSIEDLEAQVKSEKAGLNLKKIELDRAEFETPQKRLIKELQYQQALIKLDKLMRQLEMKPLLSSYDKKIQDIKIRQKEAEMESAKDALGKMVITSPDKGLFEAGDSYYYYPPVNLKIGDEVRQGQLLAKIPDVTKMVVKTSVNEVDFTKVKTGTIVRVRLDALPKIPFTGEITYVGRSCITKGEEKDKIFEVVVEIAESDLRLKPGMTVSCEFICYEGDDEIFVPNECLDRVNGKAYVYVGKESRFKKIEVTAEKSNSHHTVVSGNIKPGQPLIPVETVLIQKSI
jgi:multidrug efflux pump subunit AcrA (membrane-fusion protein)